METGTSFVVEECEIEDCTFLTELLIDLAGNEKEVTEVLVGLAGSGLDLEEEATLTMRGTW